jgi:hypothetical protein
MSPSTAEIDLTTKKEIYEQRFSTSHYFVFDPFNTDSLIGWERRGNAFVALQPNEKGWLWCEALGLWLGTWYGSVLQETTNWLRFYFPNEQLVLLPREQERQRAEQAEQREQQARQRAEQAEEKQAALRAKLQELGVDPDVL